MPIRSKPGALGWRWLLVVLRAAAMIAWFFLLIGPLFVLSFLYRRLKLAW